MTQPIYSKSHPTHPLIHVQYNFFITLLGKLFFVGLLMQLLTKFIQFLNILDLAIKMVVKKCAMSFSHHPNQMPNKHLLWRVWQYPLNQCGWQVKGLKISFTNLYDSFLCNISEGFNDYNGDMGDVRFKLKTAFSWIAHTVNDQFFCPK